jgi:hypothetical protein
MHICTRVSREPVVCESMKLSDKFARTFKMTILAAYKIKK